MVKVVDVADGKADVWLVTFVREVITKALRGENHSNSPTNHNIVREVRQIGEWYGKSTAISVIDLKFEDGQCCAILFQDGRDAPVIGVAYCPAGAGGASY